MIKRTFYIKGQKFTANVTKEGNDYVSICEEVGTTDWGESIEKSVENLKETTEEHLIVFHHKDPLAKKEYDILLRKIKKRDDKPYEDIVLLENTLYTSDSGYTVKELYKEMSKEMSKKVFYSIMKYLLTTNRLGVDKKTGLICRSWDPVGVKKALSVKNTHKKVIDRIFKCPICGKPTDYCYAGHSLCTECGWQCEGCNWPEEKDGLAEELIKRGEEITKNSTRWF